MTWRSWSASATRSPSCAMARSWNAAYRGSCTPTLSTNTPRPCSAPSLSPTRGARDPSPQRRRRTMRVLRKRTVAGIATISALALGLAACAGGEDETFGDDPVEGDETEATDAGDEGSSGGQLVIAQSSDVLTMDPHMHRNRPTQNVIHNVFESLVNMDNDLNPVAELATEWDQDD